MSWFSRLLEALFGRRPRSAPPPPPAPRPAPPPPPGKPIGEGPKPVPPAAPPPAPPLPPPAPPPPAPPPPAPGSAFLASLAQGDRTALTRADYAAVAGRLGCEVEALMAVAEVESGRLGAFGPDGRPVILFEPHVFARFTNQRYNDSHPHLSSRRWNRALYPRGGQGPIYDQLAQAYALDAEAALKATSWGRFQVLGQHFSWQGYPDAHAFVAALALSEARQLASFERFITYNGLDDEIRRLDWRGFAAGYNGPAYEQNRYHEKMAEAYARLKGTS